MKKIFLCLICIITLTGCFRRDTFEDITIHTTIYPIEYIVNRLYGNYSTIDSIYPDGVIVQVEDCEDCPNYTLTDVQLEEYSQSDLFIFNSLLHEGNYVSKMRETNNALKIINAGDNLALNDYTGVEEMWLDPFRLLTLARNIKLGFDEYLTNFYLKEEININFEELKEDLDKLGATMADTTKKAANKVIVSSTDTLKFLEKENYGLTVHSLEENDNLSQKTIDTVRSLITNEEIDYIYTPQYFELNDTIKNLIEGTDIEVLEFHTLTNLTEAEKSNKSDYFTIMYENIELLKLELY